jgi:hypothetical protein
MASVGGGATGVSVSWEAAERREAAFWANASGVVRTTAASAICVVAREAASLLKPMR